MHKIIAALVLIVASVGLGSPAQAAPPNDFGNGCVANISAPNLTLVMIARSGLNPLPVAAPITGVITKVRFNVPGGAPPFPTLVKTLRSTGTPNQYTVISQSAPLSVTGNQSLDVSLPVTAGDLLGLSGSAGALGCTTTNAADVAGQAAGDLAPGLTATFTPGTSVALPLVATVEPDVDHDGRGDTTQDPCTRSATVQTACPTISIDSFGAASRNKIDLVVSSSDPAVVTVTGSVKVAKAGHRGKATIMLTGGTQTVDGQSLGHFKVKFPSALRSALAKIAPGSSLKATLTASTTDLVGKVSTHTITVKIPGTKH